MCRANEMRRYRPGSFIVFLCLSAILFAACVASSPSQSSSDNALEQDAPAEADEPATNTPTTIASQSDDSVPVAIVIASSLNVRNGPGIDYAKIGLVHQDDELAVMGKDTNCQWLQVTTPSGLVGWVSETYVSYAWSCDTIAFVEEIPPSPEIISTPTLVSADTPTWTPAPATPTAPAPVLGN